MDDILKGKIDLADAPKAIQSCSMFYVYLEAKKIMRHKTKVDRVSALNKLPKLLQPYVKKEVERLWIIDK